MEKKISIIMPAYNYARYIQESINGILGQTYKNFEFIIVDDGSTDNTLEILNKQTDPRIRVIHKENGGCGSALNVGFSMAVGEYETWFAADNKMYPDAIKEMVLILDSKPEIDFVYCCCDEAITKDGKVELRKDYNTEGMVWNPMGFYDRFNIGVVWLWRKELRIKAGEKYMEAPCEDYDMTTRMIEAGGKFLYNPNRMGWYRIHEEGLQGKLKKEQPDYIENLVKRAKQRRDKIITDDVKNDVITPSGKTPFPTLVCISVGSLCGYRCIFCDNKHNEQIIQSTENITKFLANFKDAKMIDISGFGEFLLHPEFEKIVKLLTANKVKFSFITTGENLTPDKQELLKNSSLAQINFSLNSLNPETKKMLSGDRGNFDKVMEHFKEFVKKPRAYSVSISMVACRYTFREMPDFVRFGIEHGVNYMQINAPVNGIKYPKGFELLGDEEEWACLDEAIEIGIKNNIYVGGLRRGQENKQEKLPIQQCVSPWSNIVVTVAGDVIPCLCGIGPYIIGNINKQPFAEIWEGEKVTELRKAILAGDNKFCKLCGRYE